ncbi:MAG: hypothetical protein KC615_08445 [Anaerolineae bacterium]|nr:hypothetical protein [Anaerolineae bacterium]
MKKRLFLLLIVVVFTLISLFIYQFWPPNLAPVPNDLGRAIWLGVAWVNDSHSDEEIAELAAELRQNHVDTVYTYTSYLKDEGFNPTYGFATHFMEQLHVSAPEITVLAWIGIPTYSGDPYMQQGAYRLANGEVREQIAAFAAFTVTELGFDGVHLNAEPVPSGDEGWLMLLTEVRGQFPSNAILSVAAHALRVTEPVTSIPYPAQAYHWEEDYMRQVAELVDEVALMAYDSGLFFPRDYRNWVAYQTITFADATPGTDARLVIGLATTDEFTLSHQTQAEYLQNALAGLHMGLADLPANAIDAIALYAYWDTSAAEWALLSKP